LLTLGAMLTHHAWRSFVDRANASSPFNNNRNSTHNYKN
jgi:hypothetical protein